MRKFVLWMMSGSVSTSAISELCRGDFVPFEPIPLLILIDDTRGWCSKVVPGLKEMLNNRGFETTVHCMADGPIQLDGHRAVLLGAPTFGLGIRERAPTEEFAAYVESIEGLDEVSMGVFTVYAARPGDALQRLKGLVLRTGARFIAWHGYPRWNLGKGAHVLPAECMVRVR
jgi:hypothetical protein